MFNRLFVDPLTAGGGTTPEAFRFLWPYLIFCLAGLLICFYYSVEGRKRFVKDKPILKYMLDRYLGWFAVICFIGLPIIGAREALSGYFFAWPIWRYLWAIGLLVWAILWAFYVVRKYPKEQANFIAYQNRQQYIPKGSKRKTKVASR
jgi:hypothetical protein